MILEVYDLECLQNLFTYTGYFPKTDEWFQFVISPWKNDYKILIQHLFRDKLIMCGYNNESYDYCLIHHLINNYDKYQHESGLFISQAIFAKSQEIINQEFSAIADKNKYIPQIDLYKLMGYDNKAMHTSLKDLEIAMNLPLVEEMPIHYTTWCKEGDEECVLSYNKNDVYATYQFLLIVLGKTDNPLYKGDNRIELRQNLHKRFGINVMNTPDIRIGEQLMLKLYCETTGKNSYSLKKSGGTPRETIALKDCIPPWVNFKTKEFQELQRKFESTIVKGNDLKGSIEFSCVFHGIKIYYGLGGAHSSTEPGIYEANDEYIIVDEDIGSLYPSIAIQLGIYPQHLGIEFRDLYDKDIVSVRLAEKKKPKKDRDNVIMTGYKKAANSLYGKSNEPNSPFYDPLYTLKTTIGGQMFISMWTEKLVLACPTIKFLQHNTDGVSYLVRRVDIPKVQQVAKEMSELTGLFIEDNTYSKMILRDVNNYIAVYSDSTPEHEHLKLKGCFEIDKELHKDPSMRIVPIALKNYFVNGIPIQETIKNHKNIYDFCLRLKTNSLSIPYYRYLNKEGKIINDKLSRTTRYYISNKGGSLYKQFDKDRISGINVGFNVTLFNKYIDMEDYDINYKFYINESNKIKEIIDPTYKQLNLFE